MSFCLPLLDHIFSESLPDIALRHGLLYRPKLNDTGLDRALMVYVDHFTLYSVQSKENKIDETLLRIYGGNCKTLLTTRAGLSHRRVIFFRNVLIFLSSYPCSYSLLSTQTVSKPNSIEQNINVGGVFSLCQLNYVLPPKHSLNLRGKIKQEVICAFSCSWTNLFVDIILCAACFSECWPILEPIWCSNHCRFFFNQFCSLSKNYPKASKD